VVWKPVTIIPMFYLETILVQQLVVWLLVKAM